MDDVFFLETEEFGKIRIPWIKNAKYTHLTIFVKHDSVFIRSSTSGNISREFVQNFIHNNIRFIEKHLLKLNEKINEFELTIPDEINENSLVPFLGTMTPILKGEIRYDEINNLIFLPFRREPLKELNFFYNIQLQKYLERLLGFYKKELNVSFNKFAIKKQRGRWGSCSSMKNLNFNFALIFVPYDVLEYVVVHELAHLHEMNHSPKFYKIIENYLPNYRDSEKWLNDYGNFVIRMT